MWKHVSLHTLRQHYRVHEELFQKYCDTIQVLSLIIKILKLFINSYMLKHDDQYVRCSADNAVFYSHRKSAQLPCNKLKVLQPATFTWRGKLKINEIVR